VRRVLDAGGAGKGLIGGGKTVVHGVARDEGGSAEGDVELVTGAVVVAAGLATASRHAYGEEGGHYGRSKAV